MKSPVTGAGSQPYTANQVERAARKYPAMPERLANHMVPTMNALPSALLPFPRHQASANRLQPARKRLTVALVPTGAALSAAPYAHGQGCNCIRTTDAVGIAGGRRRSANHGNPAVRELIRDAPRGATRARALVSTIMPLPERQFCRAPWKICHPYGQCARPRGGLGPLRDSRPQGRGTAASRLLSPGIDVPQSRIFSSPPVGRESRASSATQSQSALPILPASAGAVGHSAVANQPRSAVRNHPARRVGATTRTRVTTKSHVSWPNSANLTKEP